MLSICIPTLNRAELLRKNLDHLLTFRNLNIEINISNNGSSDHTESVIAEYESKFENFNHTSFAETVDVVRNWDSVIRMATQKYVFALADDDNSLEEGLLEAIDLMESNPEIGVVYGGYKEYSLEEQFITDTKKCETIERYASSDRAKLINDHWSLEVPVFRNSIYQQCAAIHRNSWVLSWSFLSEVLVAGHEIAVTPSVFFKHYIHKDRVTERNAASAHMNFAWVSEIEVYLASTDLTPQDKFNLLFRQQSQIYNFQAQVCLRNFDYVQAKFFINKGFLYNHQHFGALIQEWDRTHLLAATFQEIKERISQKSYIKRVLLFSDDERERLFLSKHIKDIPNIEVEVVSDLQQAHYDPGIDFLVAFEQPSLDGVVSRHHALAFKTVMDLMKFTRAEIQVNLDGIT